MNDRENAARAKSGKPFSAATVILRPGNFGGRKKSRVSGGLTAAQIIGGGS